MMNIFILGSYFNADVHKVESDIMGKVFQQERLIRTVTKLQEIQGLYLYTSTPLLNGGRRQGVQYGVKVLTYLTYLPTLGSLEDSTSRMLGKDSNNVYAMSVSHA